MKVISSRFPSEGFFSSFYVAVFLLIRNSLSCHIEMAPVDVLMVPTPLKSFPLTSMLNHRQGWHRGVHNWLRQWWYVQLRQEDWRRSALPVRSPPQRQGRKIGYGRDIGAQIPGHSYVLCDLIHLSGQRVCLLFQRRAFSRKYLQSL